MKRRFIMISLLFLYIPLPGRGQESGAYVPETDTLVLKKISEWQDLKLGLMMTWGPYSQWGVVESWSLCGEDEPWCRRNEEDYEKYRKDYENLKSTFNPVRFDPARRLSKDLRVRPFCFQRVGVHTGPAGFLLEVGGKFDVQPRGFVPSPRERFAVPEQRNL